ncbi:hypothetical protein SLS53_006608 [Cytospora paraplurivora]|uniref:Uncharacterized protein n=1 Tax=Cytospora paraplurivora TaxID=2898453 RepID=A0AAN9U4S3_9PEZI
MSLNQSSPRKEPSLLDKAKQSVAVATSRVTTAARATIEEKAHDVLPATIANLAIGEREMRQRGYSSPTSTQYNLPSPEGVDIVAPDRGGEGLGREGWKEGLRQIRGQRNNGQNKVNDKGNGAETHREAAHQQARYATVEHGGLSSEESYNSRNSEESAGELEVLPDTRSWTHGVGNKRVTVPGSPPEEVQPAHHGHGRSDSGADGPKKLLEQLDASRYMPVHTTSGAEDVGSRLSRYRQMGTYFKAGSVGDTSRGRNDSKERAERLESPHN